MENAAKWHLSKGIFWVSGRGEQEDDGSDVELHVEIDRPSLFTFSVIGYRRIGKLLKCPVDKVHQEYDG